MNEQAQDALTYVRQYGNTDLFFTFTCNPKWQEIQETFLPGQNHYHRPNITVKMFNQIFKELMDLMTKGNC